MLTVGTYLADRYEIIDKIGAGGMSDVYKAKDHILERFVAIKVLKAEFSEDRSFVTKFRSEAQAAAGLEHPNIVNIYDVGSEEGLYFIVMEYVEGITLKTHIEKKGQLTFKEATSIAIQVARGIEAAHNKKITHRDIKPQNIMISTTGKVKVTDFGIARAASSNTISSDVMGSVHYSSPEQARNGFVDGRSDIYSLGIVMYEMVTGRVPFDGDTTVAVAIQHLQEDMVEPSAFAKDLPISMENIILKCTQKNPDRRYQTIVELLADLRKALANPQENFVVIAPVTDNGKTKVINTEELRRIKERDSDAEDSQVVLSKKNAEPEVDDEEDEEDENGLNPKLDKAVTIMGFVVLAIILIMIVYLIGSVMGLFRFSGNNSEKESSQNTETESQMNSQIETQSETETSTEELVPMIRIIDLSKEEAEQRLNELGMYMFVIAVQKSDKAEGTVLDQDVAENEKVPKGTTVNVVVAGAENIDYSHGNTNEGNIIVQNVVGLLEADAVRMIENQKLHPVKAYDYDDTVETGKVISQTPEGGTPVAEQSTVTIVISRGPKAVEVPSVLGESYEKAKSTLEEMGLVVDYVEEYADSVEPGYVIAQSIKSGKNVPAGTTITLTVSIEEEPVLYEFYGVYAAPAEAVSATYSLVGVDGEVYTSGTEDVSQSLSINASDMSCAEGTLTITWTILTVDEEGESATTTQTDTFNVTFTEQ